MSERLCIWCAKGQVRGESDTCSQPCAGYLAHETRRVGVAEIGPWKAARRLYATERKQGEREALDIWALAPYAKVLTLYGGGIDIDGWLALRPSLDVLAVERDKKLWPAMRVHAARAGFRFFEGELSDVDERDFDLVFADTCSEVRLAAGVAQVARRLTATGGATNTTVMGSNRANHEASALPAYRVEAIGAVLLAATGAEAECVHEYRQSNNPLPAYLFRVGPPVARWFESIPAGVGPKVCAAIAKERVIFDTHVEVGMVENAEAEYLARVAALKTMTDDEWEVAYHERIERLIKAPDPDPDLVRRPELWTEDEFVRYNQACFAARNAHQQEGERRLAGLLGSGDTAGWFAYIREYGAPPTAGTINWGFKDADANTQWLVALSLASRDIQLSNIEGRMGT